MCFILGKEYSGTRVWLALSSVLVWSLFRCQAPDVIKYACWQLTTPSRWTGTSNLAPCPAELLLKSERGTANIHISYVFKISLTEFPLLNAATATLLLRIVPLTYLFHYAYSVYSTLIKEWVPKRPSMFIHLLAYHICSSMPCQWWLLVFFAENFLMDLW